MAFPRNEKLRKDVIRLTNEGCGVKEVAARLGLPYSTVNSARQRLRAEGTLPKIEAVPVTSTRLSARYRDVLGVHQGRVSDLIAALDLDTVDWLYSKVPPGGTLADALIKIVKEVRSGT